VITISFVFQASRISTLCLVLSFFILDQLLSPSASKFLNESSFSAAAPPSDHRGEVSLHGEEWLSFSGRGIQVDTRPVLSIMQRCIGFDHREELCWFGVCQHHLHFPA
jgi:hypothetical protein